MNLTVPIISMNKEGPIVKVIDDIQRIVHDPACLVMGSSTGSTLEFAAPIRRAMKLAANLSA